MTVSYHSLSPAYEKRLLVKVCPGIREEKMPKYTSLVIADVKWHDPSVVVNGYCAP